MNWLIVRETVQLKNKNSLLDPNDEEEYAIHYIMWKFLVIMGAEVTKVQRIVKFKQKYIFKDYINLTILKLK